ncbi:hypothetical protein [Paenibacillus massiliensis]|uniref:hypothetical protein n=1 Tax=Paenibacillus massiliensis TaxID=225917 RepID=UPI00038286C9|nr:hypothetical protein [Paenibacillus massiliensis]
MKISTIKIQEKHREGYPGLIIYGDIIINDTSLHELIAHEYDFVSCLGWGNKEFQGQQIRRLLLQDHSDFSNNRNSIYICPACADLGCGAVTLEIEITNDIVKWSKFGLQDNLNNSIKYLDHIEEFHFNLDEYREALIDSKGMGSYKWPWDKD